MAGWQPLRGRGEFDRLYRTGRKLDAECVRCMFLVSEAGPPAIRAAFAVPGKTLISARRHRLKRLMREALRKEYPHLQNSLVQSGRSVSLILMFKPKKEVDARMISLQSVHASIAVLSSALRESL